MAEVKMSLEELEKIKAQVEEVKEQANKEKKELQEQAQVEKKELQDKIDNLQKEKEIFIQNQKRVILTKKFYDVKQYLPCTEENLRNTFDRAIKDTSISSHYCGYNPHLEFASQIIKDVFKELKKYCTFDKLYNSITPINDKEEHYEFINLDDAIDLALKQEDSDYTIELKQLKKEKVKLQNQLDNYDINKEQEIQEKLKEKDEELHRIIKKSTEDYNELLKTTEKQYKALEEETTKKYKALEEEFAKYKDDEEKMNMNDKLEKYQKENGDLKKKIEDLEKKLNSKSLFSKIFG